MYIINLNIPLFPHFASFVYKVSHEQEISVLSESQDIHQFRTRSQLKETPQWKNTHNNSCFGRNYRLVSLRVARSPQRLIGGPSGSHYDCKFTRNSPALLRFPPMVNNK